MTIYSYQGQILSDIGGGLAGSASCCCSGICCVCFAIDCYTTNSENGEEDKPWAGIGPGEPTFKWGCVSYYRVPDPEAEGGFVLIGSDNGAPPGGTFEYKECCTRNPCRFTDLAWYTGIPPSFNKVNGPIDEVNDEKEWSEWVKGERLSECVPNLKKADCIACSGVDPATFFEYNPEEPDAWKAYANDRCGCWNDKIIIGDRVCCSATDVPQHNIQILSDAGYPLWQTQSGTVQQCRTDLIWTGDQCLCCPSGTIQDLGIINTCYKEPELP